jgi:hypothetical protein
MKCQEVMELMQRYADRDLNHDEAATMTAHLHQCPVCEVLFERLVALSNDLEQLPKVVPPFSIVDSIMPRLEQVDRNADAVSADPLPRPGLWNRKWKQMPFKGLGGIAAACILLVVMLMNNYPFSGRQADNFIASEEMAVTESADAAQDSASMKITSRVQPEQPSLSATEKEKASEFSIANKPDEKNAQQEDAAAPAADEMSSSNEGTEVHDPNALTFMASGPTDGVSSHNGNYTAAVEDNRVVVFDAKGERIFVSEPKEADQIINLQWSPGDKFLEYDAAVGESVKHYIIDIANKTERAR